jgi:hypothetical protein
MGRYVLYGSFHHILAAAADAKGGLADLKVKICGRGEGVTARHLDDYSTHPSHHHNVYTLLSFST